MNYENILCFEIMYILDVITLKLISVEVGNVSWQCMYTVQYCINWIWWYTLVWAGGSEVEGHLWLCSKFEASLSYMRPSKIIVVIIIIKCQKFKIDS